MFGMGNVPAFTDSLRYEISDNACEHLTFPRWEETAIGMGQPSASHWQEGIGEEDVSISDCWLCTEIMKGTERICKEKLVRELSVWVTIIIIIIIIISFVQGIYVYTPETNHVSRVSSVTAILYLRFLVHVMLFSMLNVMYFYISTFRSTCALHRVAVFFSFLIHAFSVCCSGIFWMILR
jgi:hypothetical protein